MTASDIATKIAQQAGLQIGEVTATRTVFDHYSQAGQTDWEVLSALARANNLEIAVREGKFSFATPAVASAAPPAGGTADTKPLVLQLGQGSAAIPLDPDFGWPGRARSRSAAGTWRPRTR